MFRDPFPPNSETDTQFQCKHQKGWIRYAVCKDRCGMPFMYTPEYEPLQEKANIKQEALKESAYTILRETRMLLDSHTNERLLPGKVEEIYNQLKRLAVQLGYIRDDQLP